jgi:16S rRNA (cytosine1402-N4)-methyltransferase
VNQKNQAHQPVMLREVVGAFALESGGFYVDCTFGRGGHSAAILEHLSEEGRLLALDKDPDAVASEEARRLMVDPRFALEHGSFANLREYVERRAWLERVSGVLMDLGVSSPQLDEAGRGFSFMRDGPLDMRMDTSRGMTAAEWLADASESELISVLRDYGEERYARRIARAILERGSKSPIVSTRELAEIIEKAVPARERGKHPATRSFQAIRIFINRELEELEQGLRQAVDVLKPGGRLVVIAFHSLEDRIVKRFMRHEERGEAVFSHFSLHPAEPGKLKRIGKARMPEPEEVRNNPRARSAVLRVAERL